MKTIWNRKAAGVAKKPESKIKDFKINQSGRTKLKTRFVRVVIAQIKNFFNPVVFAMIVF
jgi:hypothetical protein